MLCDVDESRLQTVGDELGVSERYGDPTTMFRTAGLDCVSIAVPNALHAPLTIAALKQGLQYCVKSRWQRRWPRLAG